MAFANPVNNIIVQTGSENLNAAAVSGVTGVTVTQFGDLTIIDFGVNHLAIEGSLGINTLDTGERVMLLIGQSGATQAEIDVHVRNGGTLTIGNNTSQGTSSYSSDRFFPSIFEKASLDFGEGNTKAFANQPTLGNANSKGFLVVDAGGVLEWNGCINCCGGIGFDGLANDLSSPLPSSESTIVINNGVWDARRITERAGVGDQFLYSYSKDVTIDGFTYISNENPGIGASLIILAQPNTPPKGITPINTELAFTGSTSSANDLELIIEDYPGIIGNANGTDMTSATNNAVNTNLVKFLNSALGSLLTLNTQDPGVSSLIAVQSITARAVDSGGGNITEAVLGTQNKNNEITQDFISSGLFDLGEILLTEWNPPGGAADPVPTFNNPSNTNDDLWSFYLYSYLNESRNRLGVLMRDIGGKFLEFITTIDLSISQTDRSIVQAYQDIRNLDRLYDFSKSYKVSNIGIPSLDKPIVQSAGNKVDLLDLNLIVSGASSAFEIINNDITINPDSAPQIELVGIEAEIVDSVESDEITVLYPTGIQNDDVAYLIIGHAESEDNEFNVPSGWTLLLLEHQTGGTPDSIPGVTIFRKVITNDSGAVTVTNLGVNVSGLVGQMLVYRNLDISNTEDVILTLSSGVSGNVSAPNITTTNDKSLILSIGFADYGDQNLTGVPSGYTPVLTTKTNLGGDEGSQIGTPTVLGPFNFDSQTQNANDFIFVGPAGNGLQVANTAGNWSFDTDATASTNVGPDNGQGGVGDGYVYTEMTSQADGALWELEFNSDLDASLNSIVFSFYWAMRGSSARTRIDIQTNENGAGWITRDTTGFANAGATTPIRGTSEATSGPTTWNLETIDLSGLVTSPNTRVRLLLTSNTNPAAATEFWHNDVGIDSISITLTPSGLPGDGLIMSTAQKMKPLAGIENVGDFTFSSDEEWGAITLALRFDDTLTGDSNLESGDKFKGLITSGNVTIQDGSTINGITIDANVVLTEVIDISDTTINGNLTILTSGEYNFTNVIVTGDIINQDSTGNVQINAIGNSSLTTSEPGTTNDLVNIINSRSLTLTGITANTKVFLFNSSLLETDPNYELDAQLVNTGNYTYSFQAGVNINALIRIISLQEVPIEIDVTLNNDNIEIPISQQIDRVYENN